MEHISSVSNLSIEEFSENYFFLNKPVVIRGGVKDSVACRKWSPFYLKERIGQRRVNVSYNRKGVFNVKDILRMKMTFDEALDFMIENTSCYLQQSSIPEHYPELYPDLIQPEWLLESDRLTACHLWIGAGGCVTPLHFDTSQNFIVQISGKKELLLFAPSDTEYLYPDNNPDYAHVSLVNPDQPDTDNYPLYTQARPYCALLEAGDVLYLPYKWWHHVRSIDLSISVNYWYERFEITDTPDLRLASVEEMKNVINHFIDAGYPVDAETVLGDTNLLLAVDLGLTNVVEAFLELGANPFIESKKYEGHNAISLSGMRGHKDIMALFLKRKH